MEERREASRRRRLADEAWERKLDDAARQIFASELPEHNKRAVAAEFKAFARQHRANEKKAESRGDIWYRHTPNVDPKQLWRDWATGKPQALLAAPTGRPSLHRGWERSTYRDVKSVRHPREFPGYGRIPKLLEGPKRVLAGVTPWPRHGEPVRDWSTLVKSGRYTVRLSEVAKAYKPLTDREWDARASSHMSKGLPSIARGAGREGTFLRASGKNYSYLSNRVWANKQGREASKFFSKKPGFESVELGPENGVVERQAGRRSRKESRWDLRREMLRPERNWWYRQALP